MTAIAPVGATAQQTAGYSPKASGASAGELATLERQLSSWLNCPSSKSASTKEKIAAISGKIGVIKAQVEKAQLNRPSPPQSTTVNKSASIAAQQFQRDSLGTLLDVRG